MLIFVGILVLILVLVAIGVTLFRAVDLYRHERASGSSRWKAFWMAFWAAALELFLSVI